MIRIPRNSLATRIATSGVAGSLVLASALCAGLVFGALAGCDRGLALAKECYRIGDHARAKRLFEAEIDKDPISFEARYGYAIVLQELALRKKALGQDEAEDWLEVVKAYDVTSKLGEGGAFSGNWSIALFHLANKLYLQEKHEMALDYLAQARRLEPKNKYVLNLCGIVEYSLGRYKEAQETFEYLLAIDPGFLSAYLNLGNVLWESGQEDAALVTWKQALNMSPGNQSLIRRIETALQNISGS